MEEAWRKMPPSQWLLAAHYKYKPPAKEERYTAKDLIMQARAYKQVQERRKLLEKPKGNA